MSHVKDAGQPCTDGSARSRRSRRARLIRITGVAATVGTVLLASTSLLPKSTGRSMPVHLLSGSDGVVSAIDALGVAEQQLANDIVSNAPVSDLYNYSFVQTSDYSMLTEYVQTVAQTMTASQYPPLLAGLGDVGIPYAPYDWDAPAANMQQFLIAANADDQYSPLPINSADVYKITVNPGPGTQDLVFTVNSGNGVTESYHPIESYDLSQFTPNANGTYTITVSDTPQQGNWIDSVGGDRLIMRDTVGNWGLIHDNVNFQLVGAPEKNVTPFLTDQQIADILDTTAENLTREANSGDYLGQMYVPQVEVPENTVSPINYTVPFMPGPLDKDQIASFGNYDLQPNQALVVEVPNDIEINGTEQPISEYSSLMVTNTFGMSAPAANSTGMLNDTQVFQSGADTYYIISAENPGYANWVNDYGASHGEIWIRFQNILLPKADIPDLLGTDIKTTVVPIADVSQVVPADTPTVTTAEYASMMQERLFEWDYTHDQNGDSAWLAANLINEQVESVMGSTAYRQLLGGQGFTLGVPQEVPTVLQRMFDPALIPNVGTLAHDILTDPTGSLIALVDNVPLAIKDVELPSLLSLLSLEGVVKLHSGLSGLETLLYDTYLNPATSITAGFLNARDDLAVAIMNASPSTTFSDSSPLWASLIQLNQQVFGSLLSPTAADAAALLDPANVGTLATDLASDLDAALLGLLP